VFDFVLKAVRGFGRRFEKPASNAISCWLLPPHFWGVNAKHDWIKTEQSWVSFFTVSVGVCDAGRVFPGGKKHYIVSS